MSEINIGIIIGMVSVVIGYGISFLMDKKRGKK